MEGLLSATEWLVGAKSETAYGTDAFAGVSPTEWLNFEQFDPTSALQIVEDETIRAVHSGYRDQRFGDKTTVSWTLPLTGKSGAAGTAPAYAALLKAANFEETITASASATYSLITGTAMAKVPSVTYAYFMLEQDRVNARKQLFTGCRGNRTFTFEMGQVAKLSGEDTGRYFAFPAGAATAKPANPTSYAGNKSALLVIGLEIKIGGTAYCVEKFDFSTNWDVGEDRDACQANTTLNHIYLTRSRGNRPGGSKTLKGRSAALAAILPLLDSGAPVSFTAKLSNGTDTVTFNMPSIQYGQPSLNRNGHINFDLPYYANATGAGENEITISFT